MELDHSEIGRRIARRRKELGLRQVQVCEKAGINFAANGKAADDQNIVCGLAIGNSPSFPAQEPGNFFGKRPAF